MQYEVIKDGVKKRDIPSLREAIGGICYTSRNFSSGEFDEAIRYVESKNIKLKDDKLIGEPTISSQKKEKDFTDEDFAMAVFELKRNFCDERIEDVKKIGRTLYPCEEHNERNTTTAKDNDLKNAQSHRKIWGIIVLVAFAIIVLLILLKK